MNVRSLPQPQSKKDKETEGTSRDRRRWRERGTTHPTVARYTPSGHLGTQGIHHKKLDSIKSYFPTFRNPYDRVSFTPVPPLVTLVSRRRRDTREWEWWSHGQSLLMRHCYLPFTTHTHRGTIRHVHFLPILIHMLSRDGRSVGGQSLRDRDPTP